ncbi:MAG: DUF1684 domain-containing protein [Anaerolineae bacterium]
MSEVDDLRAEKDHFFRYTDMSPLTPEQRDTFTGLVYYPADPTYDVTAVFEPFDDARPALLITSQGDAQQFYGIGKLRFSIDGDPQALTLFQDEAGESLFLPFTDATSGGETYGAGRYVEVEGAGTEDGQTLIRIDFNKAYNPYCAYNEMWVCPIPPAENRLTAAIRAGEKTFE